MNTLVLTFKNGKNTEQLRWDLPKQKVLERDKEGRAIKTSGPFIHGRLRSTVVNTFIHEAMQHYKQSEESAERVGILAEQVNTFPARIKANDTLIRRAIDDVQAWAFSMLAADLEPFLLHRSLVRTFNSFTTGRMMDDHPIVDKPEPEETENNS